MESINEFRGDYFFLSNFFASVIFYDGAPYPTLEHAFQAAKTLDLVQRFAVLLCETPGRAKRMGKLVTLRPDWESIKLNVMKGFLKQKFVGHHDLRALLLNTGDRELIEGNDWGDTYWGICKAEGQNHLGKLLMEVRDELRYLCVQ